MEDIHLDHEDLIVEPKTGEVDKEAIEPYFQVEIPC